MTSSWGAPGSDALDDPAALQAGDRFGLLPALATAGAQVRSVAEQLGSRRFNRPRALIIIDSSRTGDGPLAAALLPRQRVPVVTTRTLPAWSGPLDLAVVLAPTPDDEPAARAAAEATRRGVGLVVRGAERGPVADAAGGALVVPRVGVPELVAGPGRLAVLLAVAHAAEVADGSAGGAGDTLALLADALDSEALACGPGVEPFVNPAVALAQRLSDSVGLFVGEDPLGMAVAARCAGAVRLLGGHPAAAQHAAGLVPGGQLTAALMRAGDPFADPERDGQHPGSIAPVLIPPAPGAEGAVGLIAALTRSLPRAVVLASDAAGAAAATGCAALILRVEFAAAYLGIVAGQIAPADGPDGLGRPGSAPSVRPATTVEGVTSHDRDELGGHRWS